MTLREYIVLRVRRLLWLSYGVMTFSALAFGFWPARSIINAVVISWVLSEIGMELMGMNGLKCPSCRVALGGVIPALKVARHGVSACCPHCSISFNQPMRRWMNA